MKIKELSMLSNIKAETIRMYRKRGMIVPERNHENGYYEYSLADYLNLLYIRKLRGCNIPLDMISYTYTHTDLTDILGSFENELEKINEQIDELEKRRFLLQVTLDHLNEHRESIEGAAEIESHDDKYDYYFVEGDDDPALPVWIQKIELFTQTVGISGEILERDEVPEKIPVRIGIGSYRDILLKSHMPIPEKAVVCPKGRYVAANIELEHPDFIPREQIMPMLDYIRAHQYRIDSDTTAFLFRIDHSGSRPKFVYRMRIKVK